MGFAKYYPGLNEKDMAFLCGLSTPAIRKYISEHSIDPDFDNALIKYRNIREYLYDENHQDATYDEIVEALNNKYGGGYSRGTVYALLNEVSLKLYWLVQDYLKNNSDATDDELAEFIKPRHKPKSEDNPKTTDEHPVKGKKPKSERDPEKIHAKYLRLAKRLRNSPPNRPAKGKISVVDLSFSPQMLPRVSDDEGDILRLIRKVWLKRVPQFECDLTFGKGDFYLKGERPPKKWKFDKYPDTDSGVLPLEEASSLIPDGSLMSVVIDLPQAISEDGNGDSSAFGSEEDMVLSYYHLIKIAYDKLKQSFDKGQGGILVVKTGDFDYKDERLWVHHFVIDLATGHHTVLTERFFDILESKGITPKFDMLLMDKAILTCAPKESDKGTASKRSKQAHSYFLIFQRTEVEKEALYIKFEDEHKTFGALHMPRRHRNDYRPNYIYGTLMWDKPPVCKFDEQGNRNYTRKFITKANPANILYASKPLSTKQLKRIEEYDGFPCGRITSLPNDLPCGEIIEKLCVKVGEYYGTLYQMNPKWRTNEARTPGNTLVCRVVSDALFRCGFVYIDFGEEGRLYLEGLEDDEA